MGRQPFPIRKIAAHAGVSDATVDRVVHDRGMVRETTKARVIRAIVELEQQQTAFELGGRTFTVDLVMHAPHRFTSAVWAAFEAAIPRLHPAFFKVRPHMFERVEPARLIDTLHTIADRGTHAIILRAPDLPEIVHVVDELAANGVAVITMVTDLPTDNRIAYVGIDNSAAGSTAAYLIDQWSPSPRRDRSDATALLTLTSQRFRGEEERELGFLRTFSTLAPSWNIQKLTETEGLDATIVEQLDHIASSTTVDAVYSIGGGNDAILRTLDRHGQRPSVYIAHDLDGENRRLLRSGQISAVLHHDLVADASRACHLIMQAHSAVRGVPSTEPATVQVITPYNMPRHLAHD